MKKTIALLAGDGIGPEVTVEAVKVLKAVAKKFKHQFTFTPGLIGAAAIDATASAFPQETIEICNKADAILFGAVGDPKYDNNPAAKVRPEQGILAMRQHFGLFANIRPVMTFPINDANNPIKPEVRKDVDFVVFRELTGGIYFGKPRGRSEDGNSAFDSCTYSREEITRISELAFKAAQARNKHVTLVDKANVLATSRLWRETVTEISKQYPDVTLDYLFVDNAAMQIIINPRQFDVMLTENLFGDILTDEASVITGSLGMLPSASIGGKIGLYEPIHGSYPQAAGKNIANPIGAILSAAMLLEYSFSMLKEAQAIRAAVVKILKQGKGTPDIVSENPNTTKEIGDKIAAAI